MMRVTFRSFAVMSLLLMLGLSVRAQEQNNASVAVDQLRVQLIEVQEKEGALRIRLQQLDEDLKPENIERVFAGIGSTRPEELREALGCRDASRASRSKNSPMQSPTPNASGM